MFTDDIIKRALEEDLGQGDLTTEAVIPETLKGIGRLKAKEDMVVAGLGVAGGVFLNVDRKLRIRQLAKDGEWISRGRIVMEVEGSFRSLLKGERVALNFLQRLSGIATLTRQFVDRLGGAKTAILDTRKTAPLLRHLDKYAVRAGGGTNHREGLYDGILIKDNHVAACGGSHREAVIRARRAHPDAPIVVEVARPDQVGEAIAAGASRLLLDNMDDAEIEACLRAAGGRVQTEVSGGVSLPRVATLARMGVDFISVGALTHSVKAPDLSFKVQPA